MGQDTNAYVENISTLNMEYKVPFINDCYRRFYKQYHREVDHAVLDCLAKGRLTLKEDVWDLEKNIAQYVGTKYAVGVNSGTDALFLSLLALGIGPGDEVITVSNTFIATIQAIVHTGATPVLVDVGDDELMDVDKFWAAITPKTKAVIPVQYTGAICNMTDIIGLAKEFSVYVVDDACQALGAEQDGQKAGTFGVLNAFSFNTAKLLGGLSDGGIVTTNDKALWEKICLLRNHYNIHQLSVDRNDYPQPEEMKWAWKSRLSNVNAAFLNVKFQTIGTILGGRAEIAKRYNEAFEGLPMGLPHDTEGRVWQEYHLQVQDRDQFAAHMKFMGVETLVRDSVPNHKIPGLGLEKYNLPVTERLAKEVVRLPLHEWLTDDEIEWVIMSVKKYYAGK